MKHEISVIFIFLIINSILTNTITFSKEKKMYDEIEGKFYTKYSKLATCADSPIINTCKQCVDPGDTSKLFYFYQIKRFDKYKYNMLIHYSDLRKEVIVSFAGPKLNSENYSYLKFIYNRGFYDLILYKIKIEKEFNQIYFNKFRPLLVDKIYKILRSGRSRYKFVFTGHSIGGSLSILAAYDMVTRHILEKNNVSIFTYGALRIGDQNFVKNVNTNLTLFKITKSDDFTVRIPNCYYSQNGKNWRCFTLPVIAKYLYKKNFPLKHYFINYLQLRQKTSKNNKIKSKKEIIMLKKSSKSFPILKKRNKISRDSKLITKKENKNNVAKLKKNDNKLAQKMLKIKLNSFKKYIFYSQPIGKHIFYNENMMTYKPCIYKNNVPLCEEALNIPNSFNINSHQQYFNFNFDNC